jgi:hypothetical protein
LNKLKEIRGENNPQIWKINLDTYVMLEIEKIKNRVNDLQASQAIAVQTMRKLFKIKV